MHHGEDLKSAVERRLAKAVVSQGATGNSHGHAASNALLMAAILAMQGDGSWSQPRAIPPKKRQYQDPEPTDMLELLRTRHKTLAKKRDKRFRAVSAKRSMTHDDVSLTCGETTVQLKNATISE